MMKASIDYASTATTGVFAKVNKDKIAAAGFSCGGVEAYEQAQDARVKTIGIFNSGQMSEDGTRKVVPAIKGKSVFFFLGGSSDIAYNNVSLQLSTIFGRRLSLTKWNRECATTQLSPPVFHLGMEIFLSVTVPRMVTRTAASLARQRNCISVGS